MCYLDKKDKYQGGEITESGFFAWYNQEITRYRDHEWKISALSTGLIAAVILFANDRDTRGLIPPGILVFGMIVFVFLMTLVEIHTHIKLNEYRIRRSLLLNGDNKHKNGLIDGTEKLPQKYNDVYSSIWDNLYFFGFILIPILTMVSAIWILILPQFRYIR